MLMLLTEHCEKMRALKRTGCRSTSRSAKSFCSWRPRGVAAVPSVVRGLGGVERNAVCGRMTLRVSKHQGSAACGKGERGMWSNDDAIVHVLQCWIVQAD